jgi:Leucine-rich repeat (LRR) protein
MICDWLGPIPKEIGLLTALEQCDLSDNQLSGLLDISSDVLVLCTVIGQGEIPKEIGNLKSLHTLSLGGNQLEGEKH